MNVKRRYVIVAVFFVGILAALAGSIHSPLLYSLEKDLFPSPFHINAEALKDQGLNSTSDVLPDVQDFIDFSGPISLSIQIHDIEQARRDLERFQKSRGSIKNLIVKLDMNESEIAEIERNSALQREILESLMNTSVTLESLQLMEIQYHSENNQDMATTVRLRGEEIRKKVKGLNTQYRNATEKVTQSAKKIGLNTTRNEESSAAVDEIVRTIENPAATPVVVRDTVLIPGDERVSLFLRPETGEYRDVIEYMGISLTLRGNTTLRANKVPIVLYMDDLPLATVQTDNFGYYNAKIPIERTKAGAHTVYARSPTSRSVNRTLTVTAVDSATFLNVSKPDTSGLVNCSGSVMANYPVRSASVEILWDDSHVLVTKTDARGEFIKEIELPPGRHTIVAKFSGSGYPINPSESKTVSVDVSLTPGYEPDYGLILIIIISAIILLLSAAAARWYLRRMTNKVLPAPDPADIPGTSPDDEDSPGTLEDLLEDKNETLGAGYARLLREQGLTAASRKAYEHLALRLARDMRVKRYRSLTAREMARTCRGKPYCSAFARFIAIYERVRYGGQVSVKDQTVFETAMNSAEDLMEGEHH
ncbi:MAG: hypothetical protein GYA23_03840 [Methanomicrobiales archaeon]|nr:hypothetical protein [Methanomicrobiales archaeon]